MKHQQVNVCMTIKLRDFAAFEDLANELGYQLSLKSLEEQAPPKRIVRRRLSTVTPEAVEEAKALRKKHPNATNKQLWQKSSKSIGLSTFGKCLQGLYG